MAIKVYSTSWCPYCHAIMDWLDNLGVKYQEVDVESKLDSGKAPVDSVPATEIDGKIVYGFDRPAILKLLKESNRCDKT